MHPHPTRPHPILLLHPHTHPSLGVMAGPTGSLSLKSLRGLLRAPCPASWALSGPQGPLMLPTQLFKTCHNPASHLPTKPHTSIHYPPRDLRIAHSGAHTLSPCLSRPTVSSHRCHQALPASPETSCISCSPHNPHMAPHGTIKVPPLSPAQHTACSSSPYSAPDGT